MHAWNYGSFALIYIYIYIEADIYIYIYIYIFGWLVPGLQLSELQLIFTCWIVYLFYYLAGKIN